MQLSGSWCFCPQPSLPGRCPLQAALEVLGSLKALRVFHCVAFVNVTDVERIKISSINCTKFSKPVAFFSFDPCFLSATSDTPR